MKITNIGAIVTPVGNSYHSGDKQSELDFIENATIYIENGKIAKITREHSSDAGDLDAEGSIVIPGLVDSHTHIIFGGNRSQEFYQRASGYTYSEILRSGNGIYKTVRDTANSSADEIFTQSMKRIADAVSHGTTTIELKTGYGLYEKEERKLLDVARKISNSGLVSTVLTYLMHVLPEGESEEAYEKYSEKILSSFRNYISFADVFCDEGAFSPNAAKAFLKFADNLGLGLKIHANEINNIGCVKACSGLNVKSFDHMIHANAEDVETIRSIGSAITLLPLTVFALDESYPDARVFIDSGVPVIIASDISPLNYNANLIFAMHLAVKYSSMKPEEALTATTINAASSLGLGEKKGTVEEGKDADIVIIDVDDYTEIPYEYGINTVKKVFHNGSLVFDRTKQFKL
ncbi:imidazolonepropionase [Thermoplasma volcanium GSS1]|uniref:Imidazolonepropionase n=1 Tax=Thermoplasma volcanium (strain ATCC 51530 / DSM 4299 / JCM 9571 / NBRC 15438 / GSS1) TaxID=273116 RepID=HUTI_THEVO|nr:imidazolonepropionase [Thermoplasma volcanium]Q978N3.1 RecName: Full=Imidazolonepropionase; AltName: Full=Imidazolone-5-propionate hydrolase [Thermoplasma volcanium GSS1]BAB60524.1 imidazolonepropionase [Thermoplasma volcanium GSS1]